MAILGELHRAGLIDSTVGTVHSATLGEALDRWDVRRTRSEVVQTFYRAAPGGVPTIVAFSQDRRFDQLDLDREAGAIRGAAHAFSKDGGLAVLHGNLAEDGCIVKPRASTQAISSSRVPRVSSRARTRRSKASWAENFRLATSLSSVTKGRAVGRACRKCFIRRAT